MSIFSKSAAHNAKSCTKFSFTLVSIAPLKNLGGAVCPQSSENLLGIFFPTSTIEISKNIYFYYQRKIIYIYIYKFSSRRCRNIKGIALSLTP
jgi:hypothetical protein